MKTTKTIFSGIWRLGRATATIMGIAVMLALTVGLASTALAGTGVGARFDLGKINKVNAVSSLVGSVSGPMLLLENDRSDRAATALSLQMDNPNLSPMRTNATGTVSNLSADAIDGQDSADFLGVDEKAKSAFNADFASFAGEAQNAQFAGDANNLDGRDASGFANGTNGKANDADRLDGKDSTQIGVNGLQRVSARSEFGSNFENSATATCPAGKVVVGTGYEVYGDSFSGFADNIQVAEVTPLDRTVEVMAWEDESTNMNWGVEATAVCATAP